MQVQGGGGGGRIENSHSELCTQTVIAQMTCINMGHINVSVIEQGWGRGGGGAEGEVGVGGGGGKGHKTVSLHLPQVLRKKLSRIRIEPKARLIISRASKHWANFLQQN